MGAFDILSLILPPEEKVFYDLFEKSCNICNDSALLLLELIETENPTDSLWSRIRELRKESNSVSDEILSCLNKTFITPIDREDIQYISSKLNRINKKISKTCLNYKIYKISPYDSKIKSHVSLLVEACSELKITLGYLKKVSKITEMIESSQKIKEIENKGDELFLQDLEDLFSGAYDTLTTIKLKDIYNSIEGALNNCSSVSDEVVKIAFKHS
jgi:uncharacterized protein